MRLAALLILLATPAFADVPNVVTDFGPVQSLVMDVMGDLGAPQALLAGGGDPHDFQLRPSQADLLAQAQVIFWVGPQLIPALGDALAALAPQAQTIALLTTTPQRSFAEGGIDPHSWLDPTIGTAW
ncbi:MAG: zinc ABC transporter substrate-binding protein, partial [Candidatus Saccharibacteria bacterium]|nr:zinc ABC transporter substrate-binding protein [Pseudorhodobacter sp.]